MVKKQKQQKLAASVRKRRTAWWQAYNGFEEKVGSGYGDDTRFRCKQPKKGMER